MKLEGLCPEMYKVVIKALDFISNSCECDNPREMCDGCKIIMEAVDLIEAHDFTKDELNKALEDAV